MLDRSARRRTAVGGLGVMGRMIIISFAVKFSLHRKTRLPPMSINTIHSTTYTSNACHQKTKENIQLNSIEFQLLVDIDVS